LDPYHKNPAKFGELRWYTTIDGVDIECPDSNPMKVNGELIYPKSRTFIPARVQDNPALVKAGYISTLQALPEPMRSKMLYGDFKSGGEEDPFQVIPSEWVRLAQERWRNRTQPTTPLSAIGLDVARGGNDKTVLTPRWDNYFGWQESHKGTETPNGSAVAGLAIGMRDKLGGNSATFINIDVIGVGASPYDFTKGFHPNTNAMNASEGSDCRDKSGQLGFINQRAEWYWRLREALDPTSGQELAIPDDREILIDLCTPRWSLTPRGIKVEAKDEIKKRIGNSPDKGDSLVYAHVIKYDPNAGFLQYYQEEYDKLKGNR
ncbi:MAG: terminase, partial [Pseudomonadota bacterium]